MNNRDLGVDLLRTLSILIVISSHYGLFPNSLLGGTHGVAIFFMVSGYCMHNSLKNREWPEFLSARFWRLMPTLFICATITSCIEWSLPEVRPDRLHSLKDYVANIACLPTGNLFCDGVYQVTKGTSISYIWIDGAYWSLLVEIRFYILLSIFFYFIKIKNISFILCLMGLFASYNFTFPLISKGQDFLIYVSFFAFGFAFRDLIVKNKNALLAASLAIATFIWNCIDGTVGLSMTLNQGNLISYFLCFVIFSSVICIFDGKSNSLISFLGVISYPLYLLHQDVGHIFIDLMSKYVNHFVAGILATTFVFAIAVVVQKFIDTIQPRLRAFSKMTKAVEIVANKS